MRDKVNIKIFSTHRELADCAKKEKQKEYVQKFLKSLELDNKTLQKCFRN